MFCVVLFYFALKLYARADLFSTHAAGQLLLLLVSCFVFVILTSRFARLFSFLLAICSPTWSAASFRCDWIECMQLLMLLLSGALRAGVVNVHCAMHALLLLSCTLHARLVDMTRVHCTAGTSVSHHLAFTRRCPARGATGPRAGLPCKFRLKTQQTTSGMKPPAPCRAVCCGWR